MHPMLLTVLITAVGSGLAFQAAANARLGAVLQMPIASALWNFLLGTMFLAALVASGAFGRPSFADAGAAPWWAWLGGLLGALFVTTTVIAVPRVGTVATFGAIICGQFIGAVLIDTRGWLGVQPIPLDASRILGVLLLIGGVLLIQHK